MDATTPDHVITHRWLVYISGPLTDLTEAERDQVKNFYVQLGEVCQQKGFTPYLPHLYGDPVKFANLSPKQIDRIDRLGVVQSYLLVAYVGKPSLGVGIEVEMAFHSNKPVVLMYESGRKISRLVRGNPAVTAEIKFTDEKDACRQLADFLNDFGQKIKSEDLPPPLSL